MSVLQETYAHFVSKRDMWKCLSLLKTYTIFSLQETCDSFRVYTIHVVISVYRHKTRDNTYLNKRHVTVQISTGDMWRLYRTCDNICTGGISKFVPWQKRCANMCLLETCDTVHSTETCDNTYPYWRGVTAQISTLDSSNA
jgi:hypothetical protein